MNIERKGEILLTGAVSANSKFSLKVKWGEAKEGRAELSASTSNRTERTFGSNHIVWNQFPLPIQIIFSIFKTLISITITRNRTSFHSKNGIRLCNFFGLLYLQHFESIPGFLFFNLDLVSRSSILLQLSFILICDFSSLFHADIRSQLENDFAPALQAMVSHQYSHCFFFVYLKSLFGS